MDNIEPPAETTNLSPLSDVRSPQVVLDHCVICLESITERAVTVPCNHVHFDFLCILSWLLDQQAKCPLCKTEVIAVQYAFHSQTDFKTFHIPLQTNSVHKPNPQTLLPSRERRRTRSPPPAVNNALLRRKYVYRHNLYSLHIGTNRLSKYRNVTPTSFSASPHLISRARKWIRRELQVFEFLSLDSTSSPRAPALTGRISFVSNNTEALLEWIILVLKSVQLKGADGRAEDLVQEFLGRENARLFLHELEAWLRSPYHSLEEWDEIVQYQTEIPYSLPPRKKRRLELGDDAEVRGVDELG